MHGMTAQSRKLSVTAGALAALRLGWTMWPTPLMIGYGAAPDLRGRGHATGAVRAVLDIAFASGHASEVFTEIVTGNIGSARVVS